MIVIAIDPGNEQSAWVLFDSVRSRVEDFGKQKNADVIARLFSWRGEVDHMAIEMVASYGMPVGAEVFDTCVAIGQFIQSWGAEHTRIFRREIKLHLCGQPRAKDGNVRQALIDRFGGKSAVGRKATPGPLYGFAGDAWQALAVAVTWSDMQSNAFVSGQATHLRSVPV